MSLWVLKKENGSVPQSTLESLGAASRFVSTTLATTLPVPLQWLPLRIDRLSSLSFYRVPSFLSVTFSPPVSLSQPSPCPFLTSPQCVSPQSWLLALFARVSPFTCTGSPFTYLAPSLALTVLEDPSPLAFIIPSYLANFSFGTLPLPVSLSQPDPCLFPTSPPSTSP